MLAGSEWSSGSGVAHAWAHGLALAHANHTTDSPPSFAQLMHHIHGTSGVFNDELAKRLGELHLPLGQQFEYDPQRGCKYWDPMQCFTAPSWISSLMDGTASTQPLFILEVRPFLGATSIALANALVYKKRTDAFIMAVDSWRANEGRVGIKQQWEQYVPPEGSVTTEPDLMYYHYLRNVATSVVSPGGYSPAWIPREFRGKPITNATDQVVPFSLASPRAKATAHWLGRKGWRPGLAYVNAPRSGADFKLDLELTWKILACGGTMAGDAYSAPEVTDAVDQFAKKHKIPVAASFIRAAGTRFEQTWPWESTPEFATRISQFTNTNFTTWALRGKPCKGTVDDTLPEVDATQQVPTEYDSFSDWSQVGELMQG